VDDEIEIAGLGELLDADAAPVLDLRLRCAGRSFRAFVMVAEEQWTVSVRDDLNRTCPGSGELYATQADAVMASLLMALEATR
jgi:hypothetical protein